MADVLMRRTRISFEAPDSGLSVAAEVAKIISPALGWSDSERQKSVAEFADIVSKEELALQSLVNS